MAVFKHVMSGPGAAGDVWTSGLHSIGPVTLAAAQAAWLVFVENIGSATNWGALWANEVAIREASTYAIDPTTGKATALARGSVSLNGVAAGDASPPRDTVVVGLRTAKPGPGGRGRMNFPLVNRTLLGSTGLIASATQTTIAAFMANALNDMATGGAVPSVWRKGLPTGDAITSVTIGAVPGSQRRRSNKIAPQYASAILA